MFKLRFVIALCFSAVITTALFLAMQYMVKTEGSGLEPDEDFESIVIGRTVVDKPPVIRSRKPKRPELVEEPDIPDVPPITQTSFEPDNILDTGVRMPRVNEGIGSVPSGPRAIVKIPPIYPDRCARRGIEGWVLVEFDINPMGLVENAKVVDAEPAGCFEKASLKAIKKWKFKARVQDGKSVYQYRMQEVIQYVIDDAA